jgi:hypothetical protein
MRSLFIVCTLFLVACAGASAGSPGPKAARDAGFRVDLPQRHWREVYADEGGMTAPGEIRFRSDFYLATLTVTLITGEASSEGIIAAALTDFSWDGLRLLGSDSRTFAIAQGEGRRTVVEVVQVANCHGIEGSCLARVEMTTDELGSFGRAYQDLDGLGDHIILE